MHIKFISRGTGSAGDAESYLTQEHDHRGEIRADVQVLRGNPSQVTALADSLEFEHRYTSGVIAWHKDDAPTDKQIAQVLDDFERVAFAGLEGNQYSWYAVLHEENDGSKHVHVVSARVELTTGKSMNIAPPNWQKTYDVLRDKYNEKYYWARPQDLSRRQTLTLDKSMIHADMPANQAKRMITNSLGDAIKNEVVTNRADVVAYLSDLGEITREGKDYISLKPNGFKKAIRLKGAVYEREFSIERFNKEVRSEKEQRVGVGQGDRSQEYKRVSTVLESIIADRAKFNQGKYLRSPKVREHQEQDHSREQRSVQQSDREELHRSKRPVSQDKSQTMDNTNSHGRVGSPGPSVGNVGNYQVPHAPTPRDNGQKSRDSETRSNSRKKEEDTRAVHSSSMGRTSTRSEEEAEHMERQRKRSMGNRLKSQGELNDTVRARVTANIESTRRAIQERVRESNTPVREELRELQDQLQSDSIRSADHHRETERGIEAIRESKSEHKDTLRRQSGDSLDRASRAFKEPLDGARERLSRLQDGVQQLGETVRDFGTKVIAKVKKVVQKVNIRFPQEERNAHSRGRGGMSR